MYSLRRAAGGGREQLAAAGMPEWLVDHLDRAFALIRDGALADTTDTVRVLTGREPRTFAAFARDHAGAFARVPAAVVKGSGGPTSSAAPRA